MAGGNLIQFKLSVAGVEQLNQLAAAEGVSPSLKAKQMLEALLAQAEVTAGSPAVAERELLRRVTQIVSLYRDRDDWDEHVTLNVFQRIRAEMPELYAHAIAGGAKTRINREIGRLVRATLGADIDFDAKDLVRACQLPRGAGELIRSYTLLYRPEEA